LRTGRSNRHTLVLSGAVPRATPAQEPTASPAERRSRRSALLAWYDANKRDLPWRRTRDPYAVWISEIMLQQTRVDSAKEHYRRFLERFPTVRALATADLADVLRVWAGLGYYRRARMLHAAAQAVLERHSGKLPASVDELRALPGIGDYTSGAIASIAFGVPAPAVDGNVDRVLSRWLAFQGDPRSTAGRARIREEATALVDGVDRPGDWTQALMELGAVVCTPTRPSCLLCPVASSCHARLRGLESEIPPPKARRAAVAVEHAAAVIEERGRWLLVKRPEESVNAGLYEFPTAELTDGSDARRALASVVRESAGLDISVGEAAAEVRHTITYRRIRVSAFHAKPRERRSADGRSGGAAAALETIWVVPSDASKAGLTAAARKIAGALLRKSASDT